MIIYAVAHFENWESWYDGFYSTELKAREAAKELVAKEQKEIEDMQRSFPDEPYIDFAEIENSVWVGGYENGIQIKIVGITVK